MACSVILHSLIFCMSTNGRFLTTTYICKRAQKMFLNTPYIKVNCCKRMLNTSSPDIIDSFTEKLVQEKIIKWDSIKSQRNRLASKDKGQQAKLQVFQLNDLEEIDIEDNIPRNIEVASKDSEFTELDSIIKDHVIERDDILSLLHKCVEHKCCPSSKILLELASKFARSGEKSGIEALQIICKQGNEEEYYNQAEYKHFMAEATWVRGNLESSLEQFLDVYKNNYTLRRKVRSMIKFLIENVVTRRGEAQLVVITNFAKMLATEYDDLYFLTFLWQYCFMSEWFSDQQVAMGLLEQFKGLCDAIIDRIPIVTMTSIRDHKVDNIQRLLEVLLRFGIKQQYGQVLRVYFDYKCNQGDLPTCSAIIRSSLELNVTMTAKQHQRFLSLLLDRQHRNISRQLTQPPPVKPFQFKF